MTVKYSSVKYIGVEVEVKQRQTLSSDMCLYPLFTVNTFHIFMAKIISFCTVAVLIVIQSTYSLIIFLPF